MNNWAEREIEIACKRENPDWDYEAFYYILTPDGEKIELNKFFKVFDANPEYDIKDIDVEITKEEFEKVKELSK